MPFGYYYFDPLYIGLVLVSFVIMAAAQIGVKSSYSKYAKIANARGLTGRDAAELVLQSGGVSDISITSVRGKLTDHYDPRSKTIRLSEGVYAANTIAAVGIAAHEAGHALQHAQGYSPLKLRSAIIPLSSYGPSIGILLLIVGALLNFEGLIWAGLILFSFAFFFQLVTLPVEFNASRRAIAAIRESGMLDEREQQGAAAVLRAAAMTYVAAMLQSFMTLLYYVIRFAGNGRGR